MEQGPAGLDARRRLATTIRDACAKAALEGYEQAATDGLCHEGAFEAAVDAIRSLDLEAILLGSS
jgi:hypothetical protein